LPEYREFEFHDWMHDGLDGQAGMERAGTDARIPVSAGNVCGVVDRAAVVLDQGNGTDVVDGFEQSGGRDTVVGATLFF
jgi:hypothetical protein